MTLVMGFFLRLRLASVPADNATMATFLFKTEPDDFSWDDLVRVGREPWNGVSNNTALIHLRACRPGDEVFIYHTGKERRIVGLARIACEPYEDPEKPGRNAKDEPKFAVVDVEPVKPVKTAVTLAEIKSDKRFADLWLVKHTRLSVMPVPAKMDKALRTMCGL